MVEVVETEASTTSVAALTETSDGMLCDWSGAGERTFSGGDVEEGASSSVVPSRAQSCPVTKPPPS